MGCRLIRLGRGLTLAELLLTVALMLVAILSLIALSISSLKATTKSVDFTRGTQVGQQWMEQQIEQAIKDSPPGSRASFFDHDNSTLPWKSRAIQLGQTRFQAQLFVQTVSTTSGAPLGTMGDNRLKKVDVTVSWWESSGQNRAGYGKLKTQLSQLVSETK